MKIHYYGKFLSSSGKEVIFNTKKKDYIDNLEKVENATILELHTAVATNKQFHTIFANYSYKSLTQDHGFYFKPGEIGKHLDYFGEYIAIVLKPGNLKSKVLILSDFPYWNDKARKINHYEYKLLSSFIKSKDIYISSTYTYNDFFESFPIEAKLPKEYLEPLVTEFCK